MAYHLQEWLDPLTVKSLWEDGESLIDARDPDPYH